MKEEDAITDASEDDSIFSMVFCILCSVQVYNVPYNTEAM